jgi:pyruvate,water dikinase
MTWAIVRRFMSGQGGFGQMYRDLGFDPDPALDDIGVFDLVCGRPYCNLSREPRMQYRLLPFEHSFAALKAAPQKAIYPQPTFNAGRAGWRFWLFLPVIFFKLLRGAGKLRRIGGTFAEQYRKVIAPSFIEETRSAAKKDLAKLTPAELLERLRYWTKRTLDDFARDSLKPTALAAVAMGNVERALVQAKGAGAGEQVQAALRDLVMGVRPDPEADLPTGIRDLAAGVIDRAKFLERFGHRGSQEMELSQPRWAEVPDTLDRMLAAAHGGSDHHATEAAASVAVWDRLSIAAAVRPRLDAELKILHSYLSLRETAKHDLLRGYALIRRLLVELDRRFDLDGGIFYLVPDELASLATTPKADTHKLIAQRRRRRELALSLPVPQVLFSDELEAIGRPVEIASAATLQGVPLSAGQAEGVALVLLEPAAVELPAEPYILVCPSTDPAWYPLFVQARGLVMETGGVLSHGAIAARELGLPAVAGLPEIQRRVQTGQRLRIDGGTGKVNILA